MHYYEIKVYGNCCYLMFVKLGCYNDQLEAMALVVELVDP